MKKILIFMSVFITLVSCNGRAKNGAKIILGNQVSSDTIAIPEPRKGFVVHSINYDDNRIVVNYLDTITMDIFSEDYYQQVFGGKTIINFVIKFTK